jgi:phosphate starvation-inducible PhoH-like protein
VIVRRAFSPPDNERLAHVCGVLDENLRAIEQGLNVVVTRRQEHFRVEGGKLQAPRALALIEALYERSGRPIDEEQLQLMLYEAQRDVIQGHAKPVAPTEVAAGDIVLHTRRSNLIGRTPNQVQYLRQILSHDITLGLGPAGTGKTFLAVACAVDALERASVQRIVLTRPAVEAGERLGFLPGDLSQKVDPYLRPLYDALHDLMGYERVTKAFERGAIEIAPLAFMRGRTLNHAFVILDEAQNATPEQMKMFLTRIGFGTKAVVTGDLTQVDLPRGARSGLADASGVLRDVVGIAVTQFGAADVVRHPLVARIVEAYEAAAARNEPAVPVERADGAPAAPATFQEGRRSARGGRS